MTNASRDGRPRLSQCGGERVAVLLSLPSGDRELCGDAAFEYDSLLGNVLRVSLDTADFDEEQTELLISEAEWNGTISRPSGEDGDCRFRLS